MNIRTKSLRVRMTDDEFQALKQASELSGRTMSEFVRLFVVDYSKSMIKAASGDVSQFSKWRSGYAASILSATVGEVEASVARKKMIDED